MKGRGGTRLLARLLARQVWADRGVVVLLALVVAGTAFLAAAVPRRVDDVSTRALRAAVADAGPLTRGITGSAVVPPLEVLPATTRWRRTTTSSGASQPVPRRRSRRGAGRPSGTSAPSSGG